MSSFVIEGGHKLSGTIMPQGAKNEALEVISAVLLTRDEVKISNVPEILDVKNLILLLQDMGVKVTRHEKGVYTFKADNLDEKYISSEEFVRKCARLRGSVMVVGPLLARFGHAYFPKPGGDKIGRRRVDTHIQGMINLGAELSYDQKLRAFYLSSDGSTAEFAREGSGFRTEKASSQGLLYAAGRGFGHRYSEYTYGSDACRGHYYNL